MKPWLFLLCTLLFIPLDLSASDEDEWKIDQTIVARDSWVINPLHDNIFNAQLILQAYEDMDIEITCISKNYSQQDERQKIFNFSVKKGDQISRSLWLHSPGSYGHIEIEIRVNDRLLDRELSIHKNSHLVSGTCKALAMSSVKTPYSGKFSGSVEGLPHNWESSTNRTAYTDAIETAPHLAPDVRFGYTGYDVVILDDLEDDSLSEQQIRALEDWMLLGGRLLWINGPRSKNSQLKKRLLHGQSIGLSTSQVIPRARGSFIHIDGERLKSELEKGPGFNGDTIRKRLYDDLMRPTGSAQLMLPNAEDNYRSYYRSRNHRGESDLLYSLTSQLFKTPPFWMVLFIFVGSVVTLQPLNRIFLKRRGLTSLYPLTVTIGSIVWIVAIYIMGVAHHGLGTNIRRAVYWNHLDQGRFVVSEQLGMIKSTSTSQSYNVSKTSLIRVHDSETSAPHILYGSQQKLDRHPVNMWQPVAFEVVDIRDLGGRLRVDASTVTNNTPLTFGAVLVRRNKTYYTVNRELTPGDTANLTALKYPKGMHPEQVLGEWLISVFQYESDDYRIDLFNKALSKASSQFVVGIGDQSPTLHLDDPSYDDSSVYYLDTP